MKKSVVYFFVSLLLLAAVTASGKIIDGKGLQITEVTAIVDNNRDTNIDFADEIKYSAEPGSSVVLEVEIANLFSLSEIEDIRAVATIKGIGNSILERSTNEIHLDRREEKRIRFSFVVPTAAKQGLYKIEIEAHGRDVIDHENQEAVFDLYLPVNQQLQQLLVLNVEIDPKVVECGENAIMTVAVANIGRDTARTQVQVVSVPLDVFKEKNIEIKSGETARSPFAFHVPEDVVEGVYRIFAAIRSGQNFATEWAELKVECAKDIMETEPEIIVSMVSALPSSEVNSEDGTLLIVLSLVAITVLIIIVALSLLRR